jgi:hypothetical protein
MNDRIAPRGPQSVDPNSVDSFVKGQELGYSGLARPCPPPEWGGARNSPIEPRGAWEQ